MTDIITKDEIKEILEDMLHFKSTIKTLEKELKRTNTGTGYCALRDNIASMKYRIDEIADKIISKINENIETKVDKTFKKFLMMDLDRASKYAIYRDRILKRMMNDLAVRKNKF